jgi:TusA-related sulfurtransferase
MDIIKEDQLLDCSGLICPMPIVKTTKAIKEMQPGQVLKVIATDAGYPPDIEAWSRHTGNPVLTSSAEDGKFIFFLQKA